MVLTPKRSLIDARYSSFVRRRMPAGRYAGSPGVLVLPLEPLAPLVPLAPLAPLELPPDEVPLPLPPLAVPELPDAPPLVVPPTPTLVFPALPPEFALLPPVAAEVAPAVGPPPTGAPNVLVQPESTTPAAASVVAKLARLTTIATSHRGARNRRLQTIPLALIASVFTRISLESNFHPPQ
jgi:hypothetical protein